MDGEGDAGANERNSQTRPPTKEPAKERNWNEIEDGRLESAGLALSSKIIAASKATPVQKSTGLLCRAMNSVRFITLSGSYESGTVGLDAEFDPPAHSI